jgi:hypothetical protein
VAANARLPFLARILLRITEWIGSLQKKRELDRNIERDAKLNKYTCKLEMVIDGWKLDFFCHPIAENERKARQLATEWGHKEYPTVVAVGAAGSSVRSPFAATNSVDASWAVTLVPDDEETKKKKKNGVFGPPRVEGTGYGAGRAL